MNILEIIEKKRDKNQLSKEEINFFITKYTTGDIADYQAAALIMAIYLNGMTDKEITDLTLAMSNSGDILNLDKLDGIIVDKHSTGGVGDKVSLILLPLVSSLGVKVAKMSGRGLGVTGGTVDKLESIPGYNTQLDIENFIKNVEEIGISMVAQTMNLAPADKKIYALRDSISCVDCIPLIASSIMSKKIASGAQKIVLDVTVGKGAFMKDIKQAEILANQMIEIGKLANRETICILTDMNEPLGHAIGNNLEVIESIEFLKGNIPEDIKNVVLELGAYMIKLAGLGNDIQENKNRMLENIQNGKALNKFMELVEKQNGDISYIKDISKFPKSRYIEPVYSNKSGNVYEINAERIGKLASDLGAGRIKKEDSIDYTAGIILNKKIGDFVKENEILAHIHTNNKEKIEESKKQIIEIIKIDEENISNTNIIKSIII